MEEVTSETYCAVERSPLQTHDRKQRKHFPRKTNNSNMLQVAVNKNEPEDRMKWARKSIPFQRKERRHVRCNNSSKSPILWIVEHIWINI